MKIDLSNWKIRFSIIMIIIAIIIFLTKILVFNDSAEVISYIWLHIGFIPIDIIIVTFVIDEIMSRKEKEAIYEKIDMLMGTFFAEIGDSLIEKISTANEYKANTEYLKSISTWDEKDFKKALKDFDEKSIKFKANVAKEDREAFLLDIKELLVEKREFLINLMNNPNLLEKDKFSNLIIAIFHLDEELERRSNLAELKESDFNHLNGDIKRVYSKLVYEWISYLEYINKHYPYMISLAIRTNPFDEDADVHVKE